MKGKIEYFQEDNDIKAFFSDIKNEPYFYLSYEEYLKVFPIEIDPNNLPYINKKIIYGHLDYFNQCYDSIFPYKWTPLLLKFLYNTGIFFE